MSDREATPSFHFGGAVQKEEVVTMDHTGQDEEDEDMPRAHPRHLFKSSATSSPAKEEEARMAPSHGEEAEEEEEVRKLPRQKLTSRSSSHSSLTTGDKIDFEAVDPELYGLRRSGRERHQRVLQVCFCFFCWFSYSSPLMVDTDQ